jgi:hypothetical protein
MDNVMILGPKAAFNWTTREALPEAEARRLYVAMRREEVAKGGLNASFARAALRMIGEEA